ncbi:MAG: hypothetical protein DDT26_00294 [Dehalococcoidia bacterium]|nr:hypothetical protein [Chloroflexota bacterium]
MNVNVDFQVERKRVEWGGQFAVEVRGLTPSDIVRVIAENPVEADAVFDALEGDVRESVASGAEPGAIADALSGDAAASFGRIAAKAPDIVAKIIAVAADSPDDWRVIRERFVLPLQFDALQEIARLTFIDPPGFRRFVGNVMALVGAFKTDQRGVNQSAV